MPKQFTAPTGELLQENLCSICQRVKWGEAVPLGHGRWRHSECAIGSESWRDYFLALPEGQQRPLREFFNLYYPHEGGMQP